MANTKRFRLPPEVAFDSTALSDFIGQKSKAPYRVQRRSIDARGKKVIVDLEIDFYDKDTPDLIDYKHPSNSVHDKKRVIIVGAGPAGLFAGLKCIELGLKPIIIERGKDVRARRRDIADINKKHIVNPESNYCFGEGGAGTYSDGKLYTRSKKRGDIKRILEILVAHGATEEILFDAHPHIGTNKLPKIIQNIREMIIELGGEVLFETKVTDFVLNADKITGVKCGNEIIEGEAVILATGHSARDIFHLLKEKKIPIEQKPFALGIRIEHQQSLIDQIQYKRPNRGDYLPASSYSLVCQTFYQESQRGVFSFCMCPGGFIVPAATSPGEIVVNGMSPSRRDSKFSNSGIVVAIENEDLKKYQSHEQLANLEFQKEIEQKAWVAGGKTQTAPAQKMLDFVNNKVSSELLETSYQPGLNSVDMRSVLPENLSSRLRDAFKFFGKRMKGYLTNEAQIVGVESRTSSPVKIPREKETLEHINIKRLFPCGEGAGYAGGIVSAAIDGEKCAKAVFETIQNEPATSIQS